MQLSDLQTHEYTGHASDGYWRMPQYAIPGSTLASVREVLKAHKYPHNGLFFGFQTQLERISRALPSYEKCKIAELRRFAQQRRLAIAEDSTHKELVEALQHADDNPRFPHFLNLPAELRVMIYREYCSPFSNDPLTLPTYPPLARASRLLHNEMISIFYSSCVFAINLLTDNDNSPHRRPPIPHVLRMHRDTTLFYKSLQPAMMACIQKLEVTFKSSRGLNKSPDVFRMRIEVPRNRERRVKVQISVSHEGDDVSLFGLQHPWVDEIMVVEWLERLKGEIVGFAKSVRERWGGRNHLAIDDVYELRSMLEDFFEDFLEEG